MARSIRRTAEEQKKLDASNAWWAAYRRLDCLCFSLIAFGISICGGVILGVGLGALATPVGNATADFESIQGGCRVVSVLSSTAVEHRYQFSLNLYSLETGDGGALYNVSDLVLQSSVQNFDGKGARWGELVGGNFQPCWRAQESRREVLARASYSYAPGSGQTFYVTDASRSGGWDCNDAVCSYLAQNALANATCTACTGCAACIKLTDPAEEAGEAAATGEAMVIAASYVLSFSGGLMLLCCGWVALVGRDRLLRCPSNDAQTSNQVCDR